nr:MAG TPA: Ead/Ea22-like protein [Caudoviricetes sp.]
MTALNKQALREAAQEEIMLRSVSDTSDAWQDEASPEAVLALLDELEKEKGYASTYEAEKWHYHGLAESEGERADRAEKALEAAEQELQALKQHVAERAEWEQKQAIKRAAGIGVKGE